MAGNPYSFTHAYTREIDRKLGTCKNQHVSGLSPAKPNSPLFLGWA